MTPLLAASFHLIDWAVVGGYMLLVIGVGVVVGRRSADRNEFFLAGRSMPWWAVAISVLATSLSAATFVGGPEKAYDTNLTYLSAQIGGFLAIVIVAVFFIPAFYRHKVTTVYELLGHHYGSIAHRAASGMFMLGRVFASGARLFIFAIPFALITFGDISPPYLIPSILIIAVVATLYTMIGGIRAVIWTDVLQAVLLVVAVLVALIVLLDMIPMDVRAIVDVLRETKQTDGTSRLTIIDTSIEPGRAFTIWTALIGWTLFNLAAFGTDQDLAQRMLTCKSARRGSLATIMSNVLGWPIVAMFLIVGLLLFILYQRPDIMGELAPAYAIDDSRKIFVEFIVNEIGPGLRGLMMAGLFAAAMSSLDSVLNAMASTTIVDFYRPWRAGKAGRKAASDAANAKAERRASRIAIVAWAVVLSAFACFCVYWQHRSGKGLIDFALAVMIFAYSGLLAVFLTALFTNRGNAVSVIAALATGFTSVLLMQDFLWNHWTRWLGIDITFAFPWQMVIATGLSFVVCCLGRRTPSAHPG